MKKLAVAALAALVAFFALPALAQSGPPFPVSKSCVWVEDGDTIDLCNHSADTRLVEFNTPEMSSFAKCSKERTWGYQARNRLIALVQSGQPLTIQFEKNVATHDVWPSYSGVPTSTVWRCGSGRTCGRLFVGGVDVGDIMISEGYALPYCVNGAPCEPLNNWCALSTYPIPQTIGAGDN